MGNIVYHKITNSVMWIRPDGSLGEFPRDDNSNIGILRTEEAAVIWIDPEANIFAIVDHQDYDELIKHRWQFVRNQAGKKMYATRMTSKTVRGVRQQTKIYMHKFILERCGADTHPKKRGQNIGDHINGDSLDNRRSNLRWATIKQNNKRRK